MDQIRVMIVDDHDVVRAGFRNWLEHEGDIVVVGEAGDGEDALRQVKELGPDVLLQDIQMSGSDGLAVIRKILSEAHSIRILAVAGLAGRSARAAIESGACGYLSKNERREQIIHAVRWAASGEKGVWMSPTVVEDMTRANAVIERAGLTKGEMKLLPLIEQSNAEIAAHLHISESTVKNHLTSIYSKLGMHTRRDVACWARGNGLLGGD